MTGTVLLIHDEIATIAAVRRIMVAEGLHVVLATSAADGLTTFNQQEPPVVVLAPAVESGRGRTVYEEIRAQPTGAKVRFLLLGQELEGAHDTELVPLPIDPEAFRLQLQRALNRTGEWELAKPATARPTSREASGGLFWAGAELTAGALDGSEVPDPWLAAGAEGAQPAAADEPGGFAEHLFDDLSVLEPELPPLALEIEKAPAVSDVVSQDEPMSEPTSAAVEPDVGVQAAASAPAAEPLPDPRAPDVAEQAEPTGRPREVAPELPTELDLDAGLITLFKNHAITEPESPQPAPEDPEETRRFDAHELEKALAREAQLAELEQVRAAAQAHLAEEQEARRAALAQVEETEQRRRALADEVEEAKRLAIAEERQVAELEEIGARARAQLQEEQQAREEALRRARDAERRRLELSAEAQAAREQAKKESQHLAELEQAREAAELKLIAERSASAEAMRLAEEASERAAELQRATLDADERARAESVGLAELERVLQEAEARVEQETRARAEAEERVEAVKTRATAMAAAVQQAKAKSQEDENHLKELQKASREAEARLTQEARSRETLQKKTVEIEARRATLAKSVEEARARAEEEHHQLAELEQRQKEAEGYLRSEAQARKEAEAKAAQTSARRAELKKKLEEAKHWSRTEAAQLAEVEQARSRVEAQLAAEEKAREVAEQKAKEAVRRRGVLEKVVREAEQKAAEQAAEIARLEAARADAERDLADRHQARKILEERGAELESQRAEQEKAAQEARQRAEEETAQLQEMEKRQAEAEVRLTEAQQARQTAEARAQELSARRASFQRALEEPVPEVPQESHVAGLPAAEVAELKERARQIRESSPPALRRRLRPLSGGRFKQPEGIDRRGAAAQETPLPQPPPAWPEEPAEPRLPSFAARGLVRDVGAAQFLASCWHDRVTGRFDLASLDGARALFFEEGRLVAALSDSPVDRLEALALRNGLITRPQERALRIEGTDLSARQLAVRMVELKLLKGTELYGLVQAYMEQVAYALFSPADPEAAYVYTPEVALPEMRVALPTHPLAFMVEGVRRKGDFDTLSQALGGPGALIRPLEGAPDVSELGLTARERRMTSLIDGLRTMEELVFASGVEPATAIKLVHALQAARVVSVEPGDPEMVSGEIPEMVIDLNRVNQKYDQLRHGDYFEILGLSRQATAYEVRQAFERLCREFSPLRFASAEDPALPSRLEEIGRMVAEAADILSDDRMRQEYARHLLELDG